MFRKEKASSEQIVLEELKKLAKSLNKKLKKPIVDPMTYKVKKATNEAGIVWNEITLQILFPSE